MRTCMIYVRPRAAGGARRDLLRTIKSWLELSEYMELAGSHVQRAKADAVDYTFTMALRAA